MFGVPYRTATVRESVLFVFLAQRPSGLGGPGRVRTDDLFHAMEARSQLRHRPALRDISRFPHQRKKPPTEFSIPSTLIAFHVNDLLQGMLDLHQLAAVLHHRVDVLICAGDFIDQARPQAGCHAVHRGFEILHRE
jgi:hypothetical protein